MTISDQVKKVLKAEKISLEELQKMLSEAAITSQRGYNRRYFEWLFVYKNDEVEKMIRQKTIILGRGEYVQYEEHDPCSGSGCRGCGWSGEIIRKVNDKRMPTDPVLTSFETYHYPKKRFK